ncbi:uncharacterized protein [Amphiura filiformis]|uniref:uncharacterized protein n=1 Tax=Amphiura filiformis TaxID=82378 RepID=UPI003B20DA93
MAIFCKEIPPFVLLILLFFITYTKSTITEEPPLNIQNFRGTLQPGYLFTRLLGELTQVKNKLVSCSSVTTSATKSSSTQHASSPSDVLQRHTRLLVGNEARHATPEPSTSTNQQLNVFQNCESSASQSSPTNDLNNAKVVKVVRDNCEKKDLLSCLGIHVVAGAMSVYRDGLRRDLNMACCKLKYCRDSRDMSSCQSCLQQDDAITKQKQSSPRQIALLKALANISCPNKQYENMACSDLNLLAFNLLAGPQSAMEWSEAIKILNKCYPAYDTDIMWLFQDMVGNMSVEDSRTFKDLLNITLVTHYANQQTNPDQSAAWARIMPCLTVVMLQHRLFRCGT